VLSPLRAATIGGLSDAPDPPGVRGGLHVDHLSITSLDRGRCRGGRLFEQLGVEQSRARWRQRDFQRSHGEQWWVRRHEREQLQQRQYQQREKHQWRQFQQQRERERR
jgi:hypothetical protein